MATHKFDKPPQSWGTSTMGVVRQSRTLGGGGKPPEFFYCAESAHFRMVLPGVLGGLVTACSCVIYISCMCGNSSQKATELSLSLVLCNVY